MDDAGIKVIGDDPKAVLRLRQLLDFVGEPVTEDAADVVMLVADADGQWPVQAVDQEAVIFIGEGLPPEVPSRLGQLVEPLRLDPLLGCLHRVHDLRRGRARCQADPQAFTEVVGATAVMGRVRSLMAKVCDHDTTVLITGEAGTEKGDVARALHQGSLRRRGPFVALSCAAFSGERLESALFGDGNGTFSGAVRAHAGRFELAAGGTLFLDDIGDMRLPLQIRMLRAIEDRETRRADVRVLAGTHRDLQGMIEAGSFRQDLYDHLNGFAINLPALRDRRDDVPLLVNAIAKRIRDEQGLIVRLTDDALEELERHGWPGNVRELKSLLERLAIEFHGEVVARADLPGEFRHSTMPRGPATPAGLPVNGLDLKSHLARLERSLIEQALEDSNRVVARAAERLHIRRTTLVEKMRKYGIGRLGHRRPNASNTAEQWVTER